MSSTDSVNTEKEPVEVLTDKDIIRIHTETFGVEPIVTGMMWDSDGFIDRVIDAINKGEP